MACWVRFNFVRPPESLASNARIRAATLGRVFKALLLVRAEQSAAALAAEPVGRAAADAAPGRPKEGGKAIGKSILMVASKRCGSSHAATHPQIGDSSWISKLMSSQPVVRKQKSRFWQQDENAYEGQVRLCWADIGSSTHLSQARRSTV